MSYTNLNKLLIGLLASALFACASIKAPEGGPKDYIKPKLITSVPLSGSQNFNGKAIVLEFSEEVAEDNPKQYFLSPLTAVTVSETGKRIKITPDSGFKPNSTYTLTLSHKVKDLRESNFLNDTTLVFSTGSTLDSLALSVTVRNTKNQPSPGNQLIILTNPQNQTFFGKTDSTANGTVANLKPGKYFAQVFSDKSENYLYDEDEHQIWFDSIMLDSTIRKTITLLPHKSNAAPVFKQRRGDTLALESEDEFEVSGVPDIALIYRSKTSKSYRYLKLENRSFPEYKDSIGNCSLDTILYDKIDSTRSLTVLPQEKNTVFSGSGKNTKVRMEFAWRIDVAPKKLEIKMDSIWSNTEYKFTPFSLEIALPSPKPGRIDIRMDTISFFNKTGYRVDSITVEKQDLETPGSISGQIISEINQPIRVELLDSELNTVGFSSTKTYVFHVKPGKYTLQTFVDWNGDNHYTGGNKKAGRKAEPLFLYPQKIELKPGWDIENLKVSPGF